MIRYGKSGRIQKIKVHNNSFEMVKALKYLGKPLTSQNSIQKEIQSWCT